MIENEIIEECRNGNLRSFSKLVIRTAPFAFSVAFRMLGNETVAEDIVQDTMVTLWQKIGRIKTAEGFRMWLYRIVINKCYDELRRKNRIKEYSPDISEWELISNHLSHDPGDEMEAREAASLVKVLTASLTPKQKAVFVLCDLEEMSADEASAVTGMRKTSVKANLHYARKKIRETITKYR